MLMNIIHEFNIEGSIGGYRLNLSNQRLQHDRRIKLVGNGVKKGNGTTVPVHREVLSYDELINDKHTMKIGDKSDEFLGFIVGFIVLHHGKLIAYFDAVDNGLDLIPYKNYINSAFKEYSMSYKPNNTAKIRRDANEHVRMIRAGMIMDT